MSEENTKERTVSDVLLNIEKKITDLLSKFIAIEFQQKLMINKINELSVNAPTITNASSPEVATISANLEPVKEPILRSGRMNMYTEDEVAEFNAFKEKKARLVNIQREATRAGGRETKNLERLQEKQNETFEFKVKKNSDGSLTKNQNYEKKVAIHQKIKTPSGGFAVGATVKIFDIDGGLITSTQSGSTGGWKAFVDPGNYRVFVELTENGKNYEFNQKLDVPKISSPIEVRQPLTFKQK